MFFALSKIVTALILPSSLVVLLIGAGMLLVMWPARARIGRWLLVTGFGLLLVLGFSPLGNALVLPLEQRAVALAGAVPEGPVSGIVILGGFEDGWVSAGRPGLAVNESAERLTEGLRLARRHPEAKIVFTGGIASLLATGQGGAESVRRYLVDVGIAPERILLEDKARNTHENATLTRAILKPALGQRFLLVTSAYHMPRSIGIFRRAGFDVVAYPVDFRTRDTGDMLRPFDTIPDGLKRVDLAAREYVGLLAYWLTGRTDALWPGPK